MRTIIEIILAAALIALGWEQPLKDRVPWLSDKSSTTASHLQPSTLSPRPTATVSGSGMWDPNRQSILDTPKPRAVPTIPVPTSSAGSWLFDPNHRSPLDPPDKKHPASTPH